MQRCVETVFTATGVTSPELTVDTTKPVSTVSTSVATLYPVSDGYVDSTTIGYRTSDAGSALLEIVSPKGP